MKKIVYNQKFDAKIIAILLCIGYLVLFLWIIFSLNNPINIKDIHFLLILLLIDLFIAAVILFIILRYKLIIDVDNNLLIFRGYFTKKKEYNLNKITYNESLKSKGYGQGDDIYRINLYYENNKICSIDSSDFYNKTKNSLTSFLKSN